jgi:uncharacterized protein (TIGR04255 family)
MITTLPTPLGGGPPDEIHLAKAPLERVIVQIRFPVILKIEDRASVSIFQEAIRAEYPVLRELRNQTVQIQVGPSGPIAMPSISRSWQFADAGGSWRIVLAPDALTMETTSYESRADLLRRWDRALRALADVFQPSLVERIGTRYVDRIVGPEYEIFETLVNPDLVGSAVAGLRGRLKYSLSEATFAVEEGELLLRWSVLPPQMSPDPSAIQLLQDPSFVLDIDVWSTDQRPFEPSPLLAAFQKLTERAYSVFRFAVTDQFLNTYVGGK